MRVIRVLFLLLLLLLAQTTLAQEPVTDDEVNDIARELYCPVCESTPLDVCPTQACADWRELIRVQLSEGRSRQEILDYFARQSGSGVLADPPRRGFALISLWLLPIAAILLALLLFGRYLRSLHSAPPATRQASASRALTPELDPYVTRIERELEGTPLNPSHPDAPCG
jgi:cytochrome c-type biogenesis protein CcmH